MLERGATGRRTSLGEETPSKWANERNMAVLLLLLLRLLLMLKLLLAPSGLDNPSERPAAPRGSRNSRNTPELYQLHFDYICIAVSGGLTRFLFLSKILPNTFSLFLLIDHAGSSPSMPGQPSSTPKTLSTLHPFFHFYGCVCSQLSMSFSLYRFLPPLFCCRFTVQSTKKAQVLIVPHVATSSPNCIEFFINFSRHCLTWQFYWAIYLQ